MGEARQSRRCRMAPKVPHSTVLSADEELLIVAFRRHTLLLLDDCRTPYKRPPHTRCCCTAVFQRQGVSRLSSGAARASEVRQLSDRYIHVARGALPNEMADRPRASLDYRY